MKQPFFSAVLCGKEGLFAYVKTETIFIICRNSINYEYSMVYCYCKFIFFYIF